MDVSKEQFTSIQMYFERALQNQQDEFEARIKYALDKESFTRVMLFLTTNKYTPMTDHGNDTLDISLNTTLSQDSTQWASYRYHLKGKDNVLRYCKENTVSFMAQHSIDKKKSLGNYPPIDLTEYGVRFSLKQEEIISDPSLVAGYIDEISRVGTMKYYRYKKRYSYLEPTTQKFRIDLTVVKSSKRPADTIVRSGVLEAPETYEVEIEYIGKPSPPKPKQPKKGATASPKVDTTTQALLHLMFTILGNVLKVIVQKDILLKQSEVDGVVVEYLRCGFPSKFKAGGEVDLGAIRKHSKKYFIGPQPVTLELMHLQEPTLGVTSILEDYTVTEKADGERYLLFISHDNKVYLINNRLDVLATGLKHKSAGTIIDGEFVTRNKFGAPIRLYMMFDIYVAEGKPVTALPLMEASGSNKAKTTTTPPPSRMEHLRAIMTSKFIPVSKDPERDRVEVKLKRFYGGSGDVVFKNAKTILDNDALNKYEYTIDGLILTPRDVPPPLGGTWTKTFKWKPPHENTIDFLCEIANDVTVENTQHVNTEHKLVNLYVGSRPYPKELNPIDVLADKVAKSNLYQKKLFASCYLDKSDDGRIYTDETHEEIRQGMIVEFAYDPTVESEFKRWKPKRIRHDKTQLFKSTRMLGGTANDYSIASSIMRSIEHPVTRALVTGASRVDKSLLQTNMEEQYYFRDQHDRLALKPLQQFHNTWVKGMTLLQRFKQKRLTLFDMGVGKAGDLMKWYHGNFAQVVGVDVSLNNILDPNDGAYKRYHEFIENKRIQSRRLKAVFLNMDASTPWTTDYVKSIDVSNHGLAGVVYGVKPYPTDLVALPSLKPFVGCVQKGFDVVSCQFAVHYFFHSNATLDTFCANLDMVLKPGGFFVGTCMDGYRVHKLIDTLPLEGKVVGRDPKTNDILWQVAKLYESFDYDVPANNIGKKITNYIQSINRIYEEYLVDFRLLRERLAPYKIALLTKADLKQLHISGDTSTETFEHAYKEMEKAYQSNPEQHAFLQTAVEGMRNPVLQEYSYLNRWFIFRKYT
jgi:SAM-dependent methyltransferase